MNQDLVDNYYLHCKVLQDYVFGKNASYVSRNITFAWTYSKNGHHETSFTQSSFSETDSKSNCLRCGFQKNCAVVGMFLQLSFLTNFTFLALEASQTYCVLQQVLSFGGFFSWKINALIGFGFPFGVTVLTASTMFASYKSPYS